MFVDLKKAYDSVRRERLWEVLMRDCRIPSSFVDVIRRLYRDACSLVNGVDADATRVHTNIGVKQGCPMSPLLFSIFFDRVAAWLTSEEAQALSTEGFGLF